MESESSDRTGEYVHGAADPDRTLELFELISEQRPGRQRSEQITLFKSVGTAAQDLSIARAVYERATQRGLGKDIGEFPHVRGF